MKIAALILFILMATALSCSKKQESLVQENLKTETPYTPIADDKMEFEVSNLPSITPSKNCCPDLSQSEKDAVKILAADVMPHVKTLERDVKVYHWTGV